MQLGTIVTLQAGDPQWDAYLNLDGSKRELTCAGVGSACLVAFGSTCAVLGAWFEDGHLDRKLGLVNERGVGSLQRLGYDLASVAWWTPVMLIFFCLSAFSVWSKRAIILRASRAGRTSANVFLGGEISVVFGFLFYLGLAKTSIVGLLGYIACMSVGFGAAMLQERRRAAKRSNLVEEYLHHQGAAQRAQGAYRHTQTAPTK